MVQKYGNRNIKAYCISALSKVGVPEEDAQMVADVLVTADLRGIGSHGISRLPIYIKRLKQGLVNATPRLKTIKSTQTSLLIDGDNGLGQVVGIKVMEQVLALARKNHQAIVAVRNTNHIGIGSYFPLMAASEDMIGLALANASAHMAPWGGIKPLLGTNPIAIAVPAGEYPPVVLDMATSVVARGKILLAAQEGDKIPLGWALDQEGNPTEDPEKAKYGSVLPVGGPKGYGLSLMVDILAGVLTGANFGGCVPSMTEDFSRRLDVGIFFAAFKIENFMSLDFFKQRMDEMIRTIKDSPQAPGVDEIFLPGECEYKIQRERLTGGIPLEENLVKELGDLAELLGIENLKPISR